MEIDALSSLFKKKCRRADIFEESFESITIAHSNDLPLARKYFQFERRGFPKFSHAIDHSGSRDLLHRAGSGNWCARLHAALIKSSRKLSKHKSHQTSED